jgi:hypothetical protein
MSDNDFDEFFVHTASVEKWLGTGSNGDVYASPAVVIQCFADDSRKLVRNANGEQVISETTLYTSILNAPLFVEKSRITVLGDSDSDELTPGRASLVIKVNANDSGDLDLPDHLAVSLT